MACMWRKHADGNGRKPPADVPPGHLAVTVEANKRFVIRTDYLNHPVLQPLLNQAYEEYGFNKKGPLAIPCDEFLFEDIIQFLRGGTTNPSRFSGHMALGNLESSLSEDSLPLLQGFYGKRSNS